MAISIGILAGMGKGPRPANEPIQINFPQGQAVKGVVELTFKTTGTGSITVAVQEYMNGVLTTIGSPLTVTQGTYRVSVTSAQWATGLVFTPSGAGGIAGNTWAVRGVASTVVIA